MQRWRGWGKKTKVGGWGAKALNIDRPDPATRHPKMASLGTNRPNGETAQVPPDCLSSPFQSFCLGVRLGGPPCIRSRFLFRAYRCNSSAAVTTPPKNASYPAALAGQDCASPMIWPLSVPMARQCNFAVCFRHILALFLRLHAIALGSMLDRGLSSSNGCSALA